MAQVDCNDFNKRMYRHGPGVSTGFCGLHCHRTRMFTTQEFSYAIKSASAQLQQVQQALAAIACPTVQTIQIGLNELTHESIGELLEEVPSGYRKNDQDTDFVYVIRLCRSTQTLVTTLWDQLDAARTLADDYCRVNRENTNPGALYVGRSKKLKSRLTQHLGTEQRGVYSMHMQRWATGNVSEISISYMKFENQEDLLVQAVEDGIWAELKPAFGRKGER